MKKKPARRIGNRCLVCKRKAEPDSLACKRHQKTKVDAKHFVLPYVVRETDPEPPAPKAQKNTLYECTRCGYGLLTEEESERHWSSLSPRSSGGTTVGEVIAKRVCKSSSDCARRTKDLVAGRTKLKNCSRSITL